MNVACTDIAMTPYSQYAVQPWIKGEILISLKGTTTDKFRSKINLDLDLN